MLPNVSPRPAFAERLDPTRLTIRRSTTADYDALIELWLRSVRATHSFLTEADIESFLPHVREALRSEALELWVASLDATTLLGFMGLAQHSLEALFLDPSFLRIGVGRRMVAHAVALKGELTVDVNEQNPDACRFYQACGFVVEGRSELDSTGRPFPILHMRRPTRTAVTGSLGLESGVVRVVDYDPAWPSMFMTEQAALRRAAGAMPIALEHIGSTAVPGLAAKPVLDIMAGFPAGGDVRQYIEIVSVAGYEHRGENGIPGREFFRRGRPRSYHVHLVEEHGRFWRDHLAFRDALRRNTALRDAYAALKQDLARRFPTDRESYTDGKTDFVRGVLARGA